jgi:type VI secretion system protein ImpC
MPERFSRSSVHLDVTAGENPAHEIPSSDTPFQILVIGDFSGRANRGLETPLDFRRAFRVDCDNLDNTVVEMEVALKLPQGTFRFRELEDFHPDRIYRNAELFRKLEDARNRPPREPSSATKSAAAPDKRPELQMGRGLLDQMTDEGEASAAAPAQPGDALADFIEKAMAPHLEKSDPGKQKWSARVDAVAGELMRAVLHHPEFQSIEAAWRGVQMLVQRLDPDSELRLYLLDATRKELLDDPRQFAEWLGTSREPWALIAGNFAFGQSAEDAADLRILGRIAAHAGAPFLAESQPPSGEEMGTEWTALRNSPEARWIGLALPRFLLRLPYGKATSEVESFAFEEMPQSVHARYLWGNPAFACACLLGEAFRNQGWDLSPGRGQISGLPLHYYREDGQSVAKPCAEILLTERDAELLLENGLIPVASMKDQDSILLPRLQSIADPLARLAGRWHAGREAS